MAGSIPPRSRCHFAMLLTFITIIVSTLSQSSQVHGLENALLDVFQISDQQAYLGKLFYYQLELKPSVKSVTFSQAGHSLANKQLPAWLYFDQTRAELFGIPLEKRVYFIQVQATVLMDDGDLRNYEDIFVIEVIDPPVYLDTIYQQQQQQAAQCRIELSRGFDTIADVHNLVVRLKSQLFESFEHPKITRRLEEEKNEFNHWLSKFEASIDLENKYRLLFDVKQCHASESDGVITFDESSQHLVALLKQLEVDTNLVRLSQTDVPVEQAKIETTTASAIRNHHNHHHQRRAHRHHRNAFVDDEIHPTPSLRKEWVTLTTSSLGSENYDPQLSRTLIPSMVSPTFTLDANSVSASDVLKAGTPQLSGLDASSAMAPNQHHYPRLYSTPLPVPDHSKLATFSLDQLLTTPVFSMSTVTIEPSRVVTSDELSSATPEQTPAKPIGEPVVESSGDDQQTTTSTTTSTTTTTQPAPIVPALAVNRKPFVNKRIRKLAITAGKYWQYRIPQDTFLDMEDGDVNKLSLSFFVDGETPSVDYWIQLNYENKYLYALPTEENIGRYRFSLQAADKMGAEVTEVVEIVVKQPRTSMSYSHVFVLEQVTWTSTYLERIQAISELLYRMAIQVFEEHSLNSLQVEHKQEVLRNVLLLSVEDKDQYWTLKWTNDSLPNFPCPVNEVNLLFSKLYDVTSPEDENGFMQPSHELLNLAPEFKIERIKRIFVRKSSCGNYALAGSNQTSSSRHKDKLVISNRLNKLGPFKVGQPFKFVIPSDTFYSVNRQANTRQLNLALAPVEPELELPDFVHFDVKEQTIYGLPWKTDSIRTYELKLTAEDPATGGTEVDLFTIDVVHDVHQRDDYLFEVTMYFLFRNVEAIGDSRLSYKEIYQLSQHIATRLMGNTNLDAFRMLDIQRHGFDKRFAEPIETPSEFELGVADNKVNIDAQETVVLPTSNAAEVIKKVKRSHRTSGHHNHLNDHHRHHQHHLDKYRDSLDDEDLFQHKHHHHHHPRRQEHKLRFKRETLTLDGEFYYQFTWTNRSLVTSFSRSTALGGGSVYETETCPKDVIMEDIYHRLFPLTSDHFVANTGLNQTMTAADIKLDKLHDLREVYSILFESVDANMVFLCLEWLPKSVCADQQEISARTLGSKPIRDEEADRREEEKSKKEPPVAQPTESATIAPADNFDFPPTTEYLGDKMLAMIIPPIAILVALLFAVCIGCCFHRANVRRKAAIGGMSAIMAGDESPNLTRKRIPIQFEFERMIRPGLMSEHEAMLDPMRSHGVQIIPMKPTTAHLPSQGGGRHAGGKPGGPHPNLPYQILPRQ